MTKLGRIAASLILALWMGAMMTQAVQAQDSASVRLHAAGSLRSAMLTIAQAFTAAYHVKVVPVFSSSGLLRERFENGEAGDVFASADMGNPQTLAQEGLAGPVVRFTRNRLCAIARPGFTLTSEALLATMLDPKTKLG